jgi:transaldolase
VDGRKSLTIKIFSDGANIDDMVSAYQSKSVDGFTTNPTLMRKAGIADYEKFAKDALARITDMPISFEVFSDEFPEMERQARKIASWGSNVYVKIPITNTKAEFAGPLIAKLAKEGIPLNITAILTLDQVRCVAKVLQPNVPSIVSVFAGRIADTGVDPIPTMRESAKILEPLPACELLWASSREALNIVQAEECGCKVITVTPDILKKMSMFGKDLRELSLDTVKMFYDDGSKAGFTL